MRVSLSLCLIEFARFSFKDKSETLSSTICNRPAPARQCKYRIYFEGNTLRMYRKNDGYYDVNLETKEEVRIGDAFLKNSESLIPVPNCIIESTLFFTVYNKLPKDAEHAMAVFDGESWRTVKLPQEVMARGKEEYLVLEGITSDSIFFTYKSRTYGTKVHLYRIPIGDGELHLEYCGRIK